MHQNLTKTILLAISLLPALAWAIPSDREQPIEIEADHAQLDDERGVTQYKGNAILTQGTLRITGDIITFYYDANQQITKAIAEGNLAKYQQIHKAGEDPVKARALQMEYHAKTQKIYLLGKGHVWKEGDEFSGNRIEYDISKNVVHANSSPVKVGDKTQRSTERVHIIIQPPGGKKTKKTTKQETPQVAPAPITTPVTPKVEPEAPAKKEKQYDTGTTTTHLNLRTGPGTQYSKLGTFKPHTQVIVLTQQKDWVQIRGRINNKAVIGWVSRRYLDLNN